LIQKISSSVTEALRDITDDSTILISGFGGAGLPIYLLDALLEQGAKELTLVSNNAGNQGVGIAKLINAGHVKKMVCSFPRQPESGAFDDLYRAGKIELELVPQGTLAERIRAGGAGIGGFYTPTGFGTELAVGKDTRVIDGVNHIFEKAIKADYALIKADKGDRWGNLVYEKESYLNEWFGQDMDGNTLSDGTYFVIFEGCGSNFNTYVDLRRN
jgi:3-oxoadipate CoA-transferase alpha subunit